MLQVTTLLTTEDVLNLPSGVRRELLDGVLVEMSPNNQTHGWLEGNVSGILWSYVKPRLLGEVMTGDVGFILRRNPDTVRAPDVAFIRAERLPAERRRGFLEIMPDLAVEVVSPTDTRAEVQLKIRDWIEAGVPLIWVVYPETESVEEVRSLLDRRILSGDAVLKDVPGLPDFSCRAAEIFE